MALILVVDDEYAVAEVLKAMIEDEGHEALAVGSAREGLELMLRKRPDLVLVDTMMPGLDGPAMVRAMERQDRALADLPVVAMSAMPEAVVGARYSRYTAFLKKPFRLVELAALLRRLLPQG